MCKLVFCVRENSEFVFVLFRSGKRFIGELRGDSNELCACGFNISKPLLQRSQMEVAKGAPGAAVESNQDWTRSEQHLQRDFRTVLIGEREVGEVGADLDRPGVVEARFVIRGCCLDNAGEVFRCLGAKAIV
jgi:hypothetical protein